MKNASITALLLLLCLSPTLGTSSKLTSNKIIFLGDSLTAGYGIESKQAYPALVEKALREDGHDISVVNAGISGSTSASAVSRLQWLIRAHGAPRILVLALGTNDGLRGQSTDKAEGHLRKTIELAQESGSHVLLGGMKIPSNYGIKYSKSFEAMYNKLSEIPGVSTIPFLLEGVAMRPELNLPDRIHPNAAGHRIMAQTVLQHLLPILEK